MNLSTRIFSGFGVLVAIQVISSLLIRRGSADECPGLVPAGRTLRNLRSRMPAGSWSAGLDGFLNA